MRLRPVHEGYRKREGTSWHRLRAERALGKPLPPNAIVHHADGSQRDDASLVICQDQAYHLLLHVRARVLRAGGNPNTDRICYTCKMVKPITAFIKFRTAKWVCFACSTAYQRARTARLKAQQ
jgi:hypothetical protein